MVFKRPKVAKVVWEVSHIEKDPELVKWSNGGTQPNYIRLEAVVNGKKAVVWTCENKLRNLGPKERVK